ncbi:MAG: 4Fe-4S dicluster domain-containing protein [Betaproteobacteria bacterium]|nr:4Fe-4S dicluster domain-containing protein [Betaproteobacteria bacterium]
MSSETKAKVSERQLVFVGDLNKCIGCQTCTVACKRLWSSNRGQDYMYWRNVETMPGMGYPMNWETKGGGFKDGVLQSGTLPSLYQYGVPFEFDYSSHLFEGKKGRVRPSPTPRSAPNWDEDVGMNKYPNNFFYYLPRMCNHCAHPACLEACPNDAIYKRKQDGAVIINQELCKGNKACIKSCPYAKPYYNSVTQKTNKCMGCFPRIEKGVAPACVAQCNGRAMQVGFIDDLASSVYKLVKQWKVALPLHSEFGTGPNVFYVPPFLGPGIEDAKGNLSDKPKIPLEHLEKLFGFDVYNALKLLRTEREKKVKGLSSELMDVLIGKNSADMMQSALT